MVRGEAETDFNAVMRLRTKRARIKAGLTQQEVATGLSVDVDTYKKWENRPTSSVPREKLLAFSVVTRIKVEQMLEQPTKRELAEIKPPPAKRKVAAKA